MSHPASTIASMSSLEVFTSAGVPTSFVRDGRTWNVGADPVRWFERLSWWESSTRMVRGTGRVDVVVWQVQARIGHNPRTPLVTFELVLGQDRETWTERSMETVAA